MAVGLGASVTILDVNVDRLNYLDDVFAGRVHLLYSNAAHLDLVLEQSDLIVGAVLIPGAKAPHLIKKDDLRRMKKGSVIVDVAVDQGGCIETTKPTTHDDPVFVVEDVIHYCVANMPGGVSRTSTQVRSPPRRCPTGCRSPTAVLRTRCGPTPPSPGDSTPTTAR